MPRKGSNSLSHQLFEGGSTYSDTYLDGIGKVGVDDLHLCATEAGRPLLHAPLFRRLDAPLHIHDAVFGTLMPPLDLHAAKRNGLGVVRHPVARVELLRMNMREVIVVHKLHEGVVILA